jgi:hypothetical protein
LGAWEQVRQVRQGRAGGDMVSYEDIVKEEDYIRANKGQCVFTGVLLIDG